MHGWIWMISREVDIFKNNNNPFVSNLKYCMLGKKQFSWITWEWLPPNPQHFCVYVLQTRTLFYINTYSNQSKELTSICCWSPKILCRSFCQLSQSCIFSVFVLFVFDTGSHYVSQLGLELVIFLPMPPPYWNYRCIPPSLPQSWPLW
jgi:hypothetical protein